MFEVGGLATTFLSVCPRWIGKVREKMRMHEASRKIKWRAEGGHRY